MALSGMIDEPITVTLATACALLSVSAATINRLVKAGRLTRLKLGGRLLFRLIDLRQLIDSLIPS